MTTLMSAAVLAFGVIAYFSMPVSDLPNIDFPYISVTVTYPGASPLTMASTTATPLERQFLQIQGVTQITSSSSAGLTVIYIQFDPTRKIDAAAQDVEAAISRAQPDLPPDLPTPPTYAKLNSNAQPIIYLTVNSRTMSEIQLYEYAEREIGTRLSTLNGVAQVSFYGNKAAMRIQVDPHALEAKGLSLTDISSAITTGTANIPTGSIDGKSYTYTIDTQGQLLTAKAFQELIVGYKNGAPIRLGEIATVIRGVSNKMLVMNISGNGKTEPGSSIVLGIFRSPGFNTVALAKDVRANLPKIEATLPSSVKLSVFYDSSLTVIESIDDVEITILITFVLVVIVVFLFLKHLRDTLIPAVSIPFSLLLTAAIMHWLNYSLDNLSLMALVLAVGFVVDDAIVELENTVRRMEEYGESAFVASVNSSQEIRFTVFSMTLSLAAIFIPLLFMPGLIGLLFKEFGGTIVLTILMSAVISMSLTPMMCARMLRPHKKDTEKKAPFLARTMDQFFDWVQHWNGRILKWVLHHRYVAIIIWVCTFGGTLFLFTLVPFSLFPDGDSGAANGAIIMRDGASTAQISALQKQVHSILQKNEDIENILTINGLGGAAGGNQGIIFMTLKPPHERKPMAEVMTDVRKELNGLMNGSVIVTPVPTLGLGGGSGTGAFSYTLTGPDSKELYQYAEEFRSRMEKLPEIRDVLSDLKLNSPTLEIHILRDRASSLGVTSAAIQRTLSLAYSGARVTTIRTEANQYDVVVELSGKYRDEAQDLSTLRVPGKDGKLIPISEVARWNKTVGPVSVQHVQQQASVAISYNLRPGVAAGDASKAVEALAAATLPKTIGHSYLGVGDLLKTVRGIMVLLVVAILLMYMILGILYESYAQPITILTSLPVAAYGGLLTLYIFGATLSIYGFIGLFLLLGIVKKNGIMIVDFALHRKEHGDSPEEAVTVASHTRFRPIMMTTLAAVMGALPIALGFGADGASRRPLGLTIVGGLIFAQVITLYVTPVFYIYMDAFEEKVLNKLALFKKHGPSDPAVAVKPPVASAPR